jgi:Ni,Fe-hydrogenase maturation factor
VFVDARRGTTPGTVVSETLTAAAAMSAFGHRLGPAALLALTVGLYGRCAQAFQVTIAGSRFDFGAALSPAIAAAIPAAADAVLAIVGDHPTSGGPSTSGTAGTPIPSPALPTS